MTGDVDENVAAFTVVVVVVVVKEGGNDVEFV